LKEIDLGEKCTSFVLDEYERNADDFNHDLLSPQAVSHYYDYYFKDDDIEKKMDYPVSGEINSIFEMLSSPNKKSGYKYTNNCPYPLDLEFQLRTAAESFKVIDEFAKAVLVPYRDGRNIIGQLLSQGSHLPNRKLIRSAQPYMVNISLHIYETLKNNQALSMDERSGVLMLKDNFYDDVLGVLPEGKKFDPLMMGF